MSQKPGLQTSTLPASSQIRDIGEKSGTVSQRFNRIHEELRQRICLLDYPPGTVLSEVELAREFNVSRTPVRRVLHKLEYEGLLQIKNGVGTIVTDIDLKTFKETYDLRMRLSDLMGDLSPVTVTEEHLMQIDKMIARARTLRREPDIKAYGRLANDLHKLLSSLTGSAVLREIVDLFYFRVARIWFTFLPELDWDHVMAAQLSELTKMREAMERNDLRAVGHIRREYLRGILVRVGQFLIEP